MQLDKMTVTVDTRFLIGGKEGVSPMWRVRILGWCARILRIPVTVQVNIT